MKGKRPREQTPEEARAEAEALRPRCEEADRRADPLLTSEMSMDEAEEEGN